MCDGFANGEDSQTTIKARTDEARPKDPKVHVIYKELNRIERQ